MDRFLPHAPTGPVQAARLFWLVMLGLLLAACGPAEKPRIADYRDLGELRIATRNDAISYRLDDDGRASGFEHDLLLALGDELDITVTFVPYPDTTRALDAVINGQAHMAAASLGMNKRLPLKWSKPLREVEYVVVGRSGSQAEGPADEAGLAGRTISARRGSLAAEKIMDIRKRRPGVNVHFPTKAGEEQLLADLAAGRLDLVATDRLHYALATHLHPALEIVHELPGRSAIAWALPADRTGLAAEVDTFIARASADGRLARLADRYFDYVRRLNDTDIATFLARIRERLPRYRAHFHEAEAQTGIDWRYIAAVAYQESHWDPQATSFTGVRGMMMLTVDTADRLGVNDRLDPRQSILGGARYLAMLKDMLPEDIDEPDRSWMATAAYNLGMGHMNGARAIARRLGKDDRAWWEMKSVLPLLSRPEYAQRLKSGPARGGEAVVMTENVRNYHDILTRLEPPYEPGLVLPRLRLGKTD
ncbi:membrane-bound lytic murein transglycosylase MltF [Thauera sp.]|uniref:membrane-bound lytic murein transglycosylase MltF n=1 Tax=Thauera sp. TaxID=1905334 RepID=UPI0039E5EA6E